MARRRRGRIRRRGRRRIVRRRRGRIRRDSIGSTTRGGRRRATRARAHPPRGNVVGVGGGSGGRSWGGHVGFNQAPRVLSSCLSPAHIQHLLNGPLSGLWARSACCDCCATLLPRGEFLQITGLVRLRLSIGGGCRYFCANVLIGAPKLTLCSSRVAHAVGRTECHNSTLFPRAGVLPFFLISSPLKSRL